MNGFDKTSLEFSKKSIREITKEISQWESIDSKIASIDDFKKLTNKITRFVPFQTFKMLNGSKLYRGRIGVFNKKSELWYPPTKFIEKLGRVNRVNKQIFYCSNSGGISIYELYPKIGDLITIVECEAKETSVQNIGVTTDLKVESDNTLFQSENGEKINLIYNFLKKEFTKKVQNGSEDLYKLSISIFEHLTDTEMVDGLIYPSIAANMTGFNIALKSEIADSHLKISKAYIVRVSEIKEKEIVFTLVDSTQRISENGTFIFNSSGEELEWAYTKTLNNKFSKLLKDGIYLKKNNEFPKAIKKFDEVLKYDSFNIAALIQRGISYYLLNKHKTAIDDFDKIIKIQPFSIQALNNRAAAFFIINDYPKSIKDYKAIIKIDPNNSDAYCGLGMNYDIINKNNLAIENYNRALELDSKSYNTYYSLANTYRKIGKNDLAIFNYSQAILLNPKSSRSYNNRGIAFAISNRLPSAIEDFKKAVKLNPKSQDAINNLKLAELQIAGD